MGTEIGGPEVGGLEKGGFIHFRAALFSPFNSTSL